MKRAHLLHNPAAGEKDFSGNELSGLVEKAGFECTQGSVKKAGWDAFDDDADFLICAGGDGTVRRIANALMNRKQVEKQFPVAILPHGTANNIAGTLGISGEVGDIIKSWQKWKLKSFDIGKLYGLQKDLFFLEGFGCGIFPRLMKVMSKTELLEDRTKEDRIKLARVLLHEIVLTYEPVACKIIADEVEYSGKYIMVEVMNTKAIGPNLELAPEADPGDGVLDVVLITESHQIEFEAFLQNRINGGSDEFSFSTVRAKKIEIQWEGKDVHLDDERLKLEGNLNVKIEVQPRRLEFLI